MNKANKVEKPRVVAVKLSDAKMKSVMGGACPAPGAGKVSLSCGVFMHL